MVINQMVKTALRAVWKFYPTDTLGQMQQTYSNTGGGEKVAYVFYTPRFKIFQRKMHYLVP